jgi:hypothetical protein
MANQKDYKSLANQYNQKDYSALAKSYNQPKDTSFEQKTEEPGYIESALRGTAQGATFGLADELAAALQHPIGAAKATANLVGADISGEDLENYIKEREESRAAYKAAEEANPLTSLAGNVVGGLIPAAAATLATGGAAPAALAAGEAAGVGTELAAAARPLSNVEKAIRLGALEGGAYGIGQSEKETLPGIVGEAAKGAAVGGAIGRATGKLGRYLLGNEAEIARGALPGEKVSEGALKEFSGSKLGQMLKGFYKAGQEGIDTSSLAAEEARKIESGEIGAETAKKITESTRKLGQQIGENIESKGAFKVPELEETLSKLPMETQEEVTKIIPGRVKQVPNVPESVINELDTTEKAIGDIIGQDTEQVVKSFQKIPGNMIDPVALEAELPYSGLSKDLADQIKQRVQENPQVMIDDLISNIVHGEEPSQNLIDFGKAVKLRSELNKLVKEASVEGVVPENIQKLQALLDRRSALKKTISSAGKVGVSEPDQQIKTLVNKFETSHIKPHEVEDASNLKDILSDFVNPDGSIDAERTIDFRQELDDFINNPNVRSRNIKNLASNMREEVSKYRAKGAGEGLYKQFSTAKSQMKQLGVDTAKATQYDIEHKIGPEFAETVAKSETLVSAKAPELKRTLEELEALHKDPTIGENLKKLRENALWSRLHEIKSGSKGSMFNDGVNRLLFAYPAETAGKLSTSPIVQATRSTGQKLLALPTEGWRAVSRQLESTSPKISKLAAEMAESTDEAKKRAILNTLNQMPQFRKAISGLAGFEEEE